jgi:hypothetical protein
VAFSFVDPSNLKEFCRDSDDYMRPFHQELAELERLGHGRPGRIPKGKPRVTDGTLAAIRRETPKRIIQQLPTGKVSIKAFPELEPYVDAILTDEILLHANSGGTPYSKAKKGIKDTMCNGSSWAYCFYNRRGAWFGADFKRVYVKDIGFEPGKTSEFDSNVMKMTAWYTVMDLKSVIYYQEQLKKKDPSFKTEWDLKILQELINAGTEDKAAENQSENEKQDNSGTAGYIKLEHVFQIGVGAKFYTYSPKLCKVVREWINPDPRGVIPLHGLVPEEDDSNPIGEPLLALSAGKQNLLDFDMQMYQYSQGLLYSPPVKKWGNINASSIKLVPDAVIDMGMNKNTGTDFEVVDLATSAQRDFAGNYGLIKSQIINEQGSTSDTSISASSGNPGFSKTDAGVNALQNRLSISDNDLRKSTENWLGRIYETLLNLHFAESKGKRELDLKKETIKRLKLDPARAEVMDFDQEFGPITFTVSAGTTETSNSKSENEEFVGLLDVTSKYGGLRPDRQMVIVNQIIKNTGVDDPEDLLYTDDEIEQAKMLALNPPAPESVSDPNMQPMEQPIPPEVPQAMELQQPIPGPMPTADAQGMSPAEMQIMQALQQEGFSNEDIATAITLKREGYSNDEIEQILGGGNG